MEKPFSTCAVCQLFHCREESGGTLDGKSGYVVRELKGTYSETCVKCTIKLTFIKQSPLLRGRCHLFRGSEELLFIVFISIMMYHTITTVTLSIAFSAAL